MFSKDLSTSLLTLDRDYSIKIETEQQRGTYTAPSGKANQRAVGESSVCGMKIEQSQMLGAFFSDERLEQMDKPRQTIGSKDMTGKDYIDNLIDQQENFYHKKLPFEFGQYHQCIPNPRQEKQLITVQFIKRALEGMPLSSKTGQGDADELFAEGQGDGFNKAVRFQKFNLQEPGTVDEGEADYSDEDQNDQQDDAFSNFVDQSQISSSRALSSRRNSIVLQDALLSGNPAEGSLLDASQPHEKVCDVAGVTPKLYADIAKDDKEQKKISTDCEDFAVIAFWDLNSEDNLFKCSRHFYVPCPKKRTVHELCGTEIHEFLFVSQHTRNANKDVFFYFEGAEVEINQDMDEVDGSVKVLQCAFIKLTPDQEIQSDPDALSDWLSQHSMSFHCSDFKKIDANSVLHKYIIDQNATKYSDQQQLPNPTMIDSLCVDGNEKASGKTVVFTAFLYQDLVTNKDTGDLDIIIHKCWYPTVYFYCLEQDQVVWSVPGAEVFICLTPNRRAFFLTNRIWYKLEQKQYEELRANTDCFSRFKEFAGSVLEIQYMSMPVQMTSDDEDGQEQAPMWEREAPKTPFLNDYKLTFGKNKNLEITESAKVVEAYMHNVLRRMTLLYRGVGAFTFLLVESKPLTVMSQWQVYWQDQKYLANLTFIPKEQKFIGEGIDERDQQVSLEITLNVKDNYPWLIQIENEYETENHNDVNLIVDQDEHTFCASWTVNDSEFTLYGEFNPSTREVQFNIYNSEDDSQRDFVGKFKNMFTTIRGHYCNAGDDPIKDGKAFRMRVDATIDGNLTITKKVEGVDQTDEISVQVDFKETLIKSTHDQSLMIEALESVDTGGLLFFIFGSGLSFLRVGPSSYVQSQLDATADWDDNSNGTGVVQSSVILYKVSCQLANIKKDKLHKKLMYKSEPESRTSVNFYMNQTIMSTLKEYTTHIIMMGASMVYPDGNCLRFLSSVLFERTGSDELKLCFVTARIPMPTASKAAGNKSFCYPSEYPQQPVPQSWIVDYPLLAYKTFSPTNREIAIVHMAQNMPQRIINLGMWEFVCFVHHTQMTEQRLYAAQRETNCDITFLVRDGSTYRLMSFKSNPWLSYNKDIDKNDLESVAQSLYIFSGKLNFNPDPDYKSNDATSNPHLQSCNFSRRFSSDKIQQAQLVTKDRSGQQQYILIIQFDDSIVEASLNLNKFKVICEPEAMIRRHIVRGYNEVIFFAETHGNSEKIQQLEFHQSMHNTIIKKEIFTLASSWLVALEIDAQNIGNDNEDQVMNSLFVMDDQQRIFMICDEDGVHFKVSRLIDFSSHNKMAEVSSLRDNDWLHVHVSNRTISFGENTYNLNSDLTQEISVPKNYFGQEVIHTNIQENNQKIDDDNEENEKEKEKHDFEQFESTDAWTIEAVRAMPETANIILMAQKNHHEFCFVIKPAPGTRRVSVVAYQQQLEIEQMLFVTNTHILMKFRSGKCVTFQMNGIVVHQNDQLQRYLDESQSIVSESIIKDGRKSILLVQYDKKLERYIYTCIQFEPNGFGNIVGKFIDPIKEAKVKLLEHLITPVKQAVSAKTFKKALGLGTTQKNNFLKMLLNKQSQVQAIKKVQAVKNTKDKVSFRKDFYCTTKGEIIKIAAIVTENAKILEDIKLDDRKKKLDDRKQKNKDQKAFNKQDENGEKQVIQSDTKKFYISTLEGENKWFEPKCVYRTLVFHCRSIAEMKSIKTDYEFCIAGDYLCMRHRQMRNIYAIPIARDDLDSGDELTEEGHIRCDTVYEDDAIELVQVSRTATIINMTKMCEEKDNDLISMLPMPSSLFTAIDNHRKLEINFHENVVQFLVHNRAVLYNLDSAEQIGAIEGIDQLMNPDESVSTGYCMQTSKREIQDQTKFIRQHSFIMNEFTNLLFEKTVDILPDDTSKTLIPGSLYRLNSEIDLFELKATQAALDANSKMRKIDLQSILATYQGHTIFSIFQDKVAVYDQILDQFESEDFDDGEDFDGLDQENSTIRRLYRTLALPTADWIDRKQKILDVESDEKLVQNRCGRLGQQMRTIIGMADGKKDPYRKLGFKPVCQKSLHFTNSRQRESLMQLALLCQETQMSTFVSNLEDLETLLESMTPVVQEFLDNSHTTNVYTNRIENLNWKKGAERKVIGMKTSFITQKTVNNLLQNHRKEVSLLYRISCGLWSSKDSTSIQNRQVIATVMHLKWLGAAYKGREKPGFQELIVALARVPNEEAFATEPIRSLTQLCWQTYYDQVRHFCFYPFLLYFTASLNYMTHYAVDGVEPNNNWDSTKEFVYRMFVIIGTIYFSSFEIIQMVRGGMIDYFKDVVFNSVDLMLPFLQFYLTRCGRGASNLAEGEEIDTTRRALASLTSILLWIKAFYWLRLFEQTSIYIRLITETLWEIKFFLILFVFCLMMFGNAILIMDTGRNPRYTQDYFNNDYLNIIFDQYLLSLGEFNGDGYFQPGADKAVIAIFVVSTFLTSITFLNMLIAIMGDAYQKVSEKKEQAALKEKIGILADHCFIVSRDNTIDQVKYMFTIVPNAKEAGDGVNWEGTVSAIKRHVTDARTLINADFQLKLKDLQCEIKSAARGFIYLNERITNNQAVVQKTLTGMEGIIKRIAGESTTGNDEQ